MVRNWSLAVVLTALLLPIQAFALGVGEIHTQSALNQPFKGYVDLVSVPEEEIGGVKVKLASQEAFDKVGVERLFVLTDLDFNTEMVRGKPRITISSKRPIREPYLNFLISVTWPKGHVLKEYTVLLDPPVTVARKPARVKQATSSSSSSSSSTAYNQGGYSAYPVDGGQAQAGEYGPVQPNETLWEIAAAVKPADVTVEQMMMGLLHENPHAFINNNVNLLKKGKILKIPSAEKLLGRQQAHAEFSAQVNDWRSSQAASNDSVTDAGGEEAPVEDTDTLELLAASDGTSSNGAEGGDAAIAAQNQNLKNQLLIEREKNEASKQDNAELDDRVKELEAQIAEFQTLISLKDNKLNELTRQLSAQKEAEQASADLAAQEAMPDEAETAVAETEVEEVTPEEVIVEDTGELEGEAVAVDESELAGSDETEMPADESVIAETPVDVIPDESEQVDIDVEMGGDDAAIAGMEDEMAAETPATGEESVYDSALVDTEIEPGMEETDIVDIEEEPVAGATEVTEVADTEEVTPPVAEPVAPVAPISIQEDEGGLLDNEYLIYAAAGVGGLLLLALVGLFISRRKSAGSEFEESILDPMAEDKLEEEAVEAGGAETDLDQTDETSFLSDFLPSDIDDVMQDETGEVDPVSEADVYIAYGRYSQAEELIRQAIEKDPARSDLHEKLMEIFYAGKNISGFVSEAEKMNSEGVPASDADLWQRVVSMGKEVAPDHQLFGGEGMTEESVAAVEEEPLQRDSDLIDTVDGDSAAILAELESELADLDSELEAVATPAPETAPVEEQAADAVDLDQLSELDLSIDLDSVQDDDIDAAIAEQSAETSSMAEPDSLEIDLDSFDIDSISIDEPVADEPVIEETVEEILENESILRDEPVSEMQEQVDTRDSDDLSSIDLEDLTTEVHDDLVVEEADEEDMDEVNTKLDLARAYMDMGDTDGAKDILGEVMNEGSDQQKDEAREILDKL
ncbi:MAG: hypothetical protein KZQ58_04980 [gamma proteobacterium symbiont of Bathyaustriella thionipta]|nr:hypothetical protein [gamma proteobacterium symbiont of Bathyaustriella thionipta]